MCFSFLHYNQTNILLLNDIKGVRELILFFISSGRTFILLLFTEHTLELHDFAHLLSYFTSELLLSLEEKENIREWILFHRQCRAAAYIWYICNPVVVINFISQI